VNKLEKPNWKRRQERKKRRTIIFAVAGFSVLSLAVLAVLVFPDLNLRLNSSAEAVEYSNKTYTAQTSAQFVAALERAQPGETILLKAGATFKGAFKLPKKNGKEFITIRTSADDAQLPPADTRIDPAKYGAALPKIISDVRGEPALLIADGASYYRFVGVEFGPTVEGQNNIIQIGTTEEKRIEELPHHIEFDRVYIRGDKTFGQRRGIAANGRFIKIKNSHISDIKRKGDESAAIGAWATDGPIEITNNYLEAAAMSILFGGGGSTLRLVPTDCIVRDNWMNKPVKWREEGWAVKNIFEIKFGRRIRVENNLMTGNWGSAQEGTAILFTTREDIGEATIIEDIEFVNNIVRGSANAVNILGSEGSGGHRLTIRNNIFDDINGQKWGSVGYFLKATDWNGLTIENNTIINSGNITVAYGKPVRGLVFRNNIVFENEYGFAGDDAAPGRGAIDRYFPNADISFNAIVGGASKNYGLKNFFPTSVRQLGLMNAENGDLRLRPDSPLRGKGFQGKNIGADLDPKTIGGK
jgi:hypothetical protein